MMGRGIRGAMMLLACTLLLCHGLPIAQASGGLATSGSLNQAPTVEVHEGSTCEWCEVSPILGETAWLRGGYSDARALTHTPHSLAPHAHAHGTGAKWTCSVCPESSICGECYSSVAAGGEYLPAGHEGGVSSNKFGGMIIPTSYLVSFPLPLSLSHSLSRLPSLPVSLRLSRMPTP